jgi:hypothetical protein
MKIAKERSNQTYCFNNTFIEIHAVALNDKGKQLNSWHLVLNIHYRQYCEFA